QTHAAELAKGKAKGVAIAEANDFSREVMAVGGFNHDAPANPELANGANDLNEEALDGFHTPKHLDLFDGVDGRNQRLHCLSIRSTSACLRTGRLVWLTIMVSTDGRIMGSDESERNRSLTEKLYPEGECANCALWPDCGQTLPNSCD